MKSFLLALTLLAATPLAAQEYADSIASDNSAVDIKSLDGIVSGAMAESFELCGRLNTAFTDQAREQPTVAAALRAGATPKTCSLTNKKAIFVNDDNTYTASTLPSFIRNAIDECRALGTTIDDICLTDMGWWAIVYDNGTKLKGEIPETCQNELEGLVAQGERIVSLSISNNGEYAFLTNESYGASNSVDETVIEQGIVYYGQPLSVCITDRGCCVTCERGIFFWDMPSNIYEELQRHDATPTMLRFTDSGTFLAIDGKGLAIRNL